MFARVKLWLQVAWSQMIFPFKKRAGFLDLGDAFVEGVVRQIDDKISDDGDFCFIVKLDVGFEHYDTYYDHTNPTPGTIQCEVMPKARLDEVMAIACKVLKVGDRVRVTGRLAFDGAHDGGTLNDVWGAIVGREPNIAGGWTEIHPVSRIEFLET